MGVGQGLGVHRVHVIIGCAGKGAWRGREMGGGVENFYHGLKRKSFRSIPRAKVVILYSYFFKYGYVFVWTDYKHKWMNYEIFVICGCGPSLFLFLSLIFTRWSMLDALITPTSHETSFIAYKTRNKKTSL